MARKPPPAGRSTLPRATRGEIQVIPSAQIRLQLKQCQEDAAGARECASWTGLNSFSRLERQLWIDLHAAEQREAAARTSEAARAEAGVDDDAVFAEVLSAIASLPQPMRERLAGALIGAPVLRVVGE